MPARFRDLVARKHRAVRRGTLCGVIGAAGVGGGSASLGGLAAGNIRGIVVTGPGRVVGPGIVRDGGVRSLAPDCIGGIAVTGTV